MVRIRIIPGNKVKAKKFQTTTAKVVKAFEISPQKRMEKINWRL